MKLDRMKLSDVFGPRDALPILIAQEIRKQLNLKFEAAPLSEISHELGVFKISEVPMSKMEGTIVFPPGKHEAEITLKINQDANRKRFTWAHELGHLTNPFHHAEKDDGFHCSDKDIFRYGANRVELEASRFASELLLPEHHLKNFLSDDKNHSLSRIVDLCEHMEISKAASIRRISASCYHPVAFIFSRDETMNYFKARNFPRLIQITKNPLPETSLARTFVGQDNTCSDPVETDGVNWLVNGKGVQLIEQLFVQEDGYKITMLRLL